MKILRIIASANPKNGGPIEGLKQMSAALARAGHLTEVACLDAPDAPWIKSFPFKTYPLGPGFLNYGYSRRFISWLEQHAKDYDSILIHGLWQFTGTGSRRVLRKKKIPYWIYTHGMLDPWFKTAYPVKNIKKWVYWLFFERFVLRDAAAVIFTSEEERRLAQTSFPFYQCRETVLHYGTAEPLGDPENHKKLFLSRFPELAGKKNLLFLGRIHPKKGCDLLIEAFAQAAKQNPDLRLVMAGPDESGWAKDLKALLKSQNMEDRVVWTGMLRGEEKWGAFRSSEAFILPSHQENFGIAVAEALACDLPVLITKRVNIWQEIVRSGAGLAEEDTAEGVRRLLAQWLKIFPAEAQEMKVRAKKCFRENFEIGQAAEGLITTIQAQEPLSLFKHN